MYPNTDFTRNTWPAFPGLHNNSLKITPTVQEDKSPETEKYIYGVLDEEFDSIDLCEFISPGFISFPGKTDGYYGQDPNTPDPGPQPNQPGQPNTPNQPDIPGQPGQQPEFPKPNQPQAPPEHPGQVQPNREVERPGSPVVPPTQPPTTPQLTHF